MIRRQIPSWMFWLLSIGGIVVLLTCYEIVSVRQTRTNELQTTIPSFSKLGEGLVKIFRPQGDAENPKPAIFWVDIRATLWRLFLGMSVGVCLSIFVGVLMGAYRWIEAPLEPIVMFLSKVPPTAMMPIYFAVVGTDQKMFASMVALGIFFSMTQSIYQAVKQDVADESIDKAYTLGASEIEIIYEVIWKQILPKVIDSIRLQIGPAMVFLLAAEMVVGDAGLGYRIRMQSRVLNMNVVYVYLAILATIGLLAEWGLATLQRKLCPWFVD
ncbi:MAG: ABC transporter permease subunit [Pirellula sp.]